MRRNGLLVGGWAVATLLALILGLQGIHSVSNSVTDHRPAPLSPSSVRAALQRTSASTSTTTVASGSSESSAAGGGPAGSSLSSDVVVPHVNGDDGPTASDVPSTTAIASSIGGTPTTSSPNSEAETESAGSSSSESTAPFEDHIYELEGGTVAVRFQNGAAHLLWATPNGDEGYRTDQAQEDGGTVDVRFRNDEHESRLRAYWDDGPHADTEEND